MKKICKSYIKLNGDENNVIDMARSNGSYVSDFDKISEDDSGYQAFSRMEQIYDDDNEDFDLQARIVSNSVPDLHSKGKLREEANDMKPMTFIHIHDSKEFQISPGNGSTSFHKTTKQRIYSEEHYLSTRDSILRTFPKVETELFQGGLECLNRENCFPLVIFKGSGCGCNFAAKMLFERTVSNADKETNFYSMDNPEEPLPLVYNEKCILLVLNASGPIGEDINRLNRWYEVLQRYFATGITVRRNLTVIMSLKDSRNGCPEIVHHPFFKRYTDYILDETESIYRPSKETKKRLVDALMSQHKLKTKSFKDVNLNAHKEDRNTTLIAKETVDGIVPLLGSIGCIGNLDAFCISRMAEGLNFLRKPIPDVVDKIRESFNEGGVLFLTLLAVHLHGGQFGSGRVSQMRRSNEQTEEFWYSLANMDNLPKKKPTRIQKVFDSTEIKYLHRFAKEHGHLLCLGNKLQKCVRMFDGKFLSEHNGVYSFSNCRVYFSFLLVYYKMYPEALEYCNDTFFFNFVKPITLSFETNEAHFLAVDDRCQNRVSEAVMKRFEKEIMLRNVAKCMNHPMMSTTFFQLFLRYLEQTPHLLWKVLTQLDSDPKEAYSCLYHGMEEEENTLKEEPRNISEVVILHAVWKRKRSKKKWKTWTETQERQCLIHAIEMRNRQTIGLLIGNGVTVHVAALKTAIDVGDETTLMFMIEKVQFCRREWYEVAQYAAEKLCEEPPSKDLVDILSQIILKTDLNAECSGKAPLIHYAVQSNKPKMLGMLLEGRIVNKGININRLYKRETPLTVATRLGYGCIVTILLDKNAYIGETEVFIACKEGHHEILRMLVNKKPSLL